MSPFVTESAFIVSVPFLAPEIYRIIKPPLGQRRMDNPTGRPRKIDGARIAHIAQIKCQHVINVKFEVDSRPSPQMPWLRRDKSTSIAKKQIHDKRDGTNPRELRRDITTRIATIQIHEDCDETNPRGLRREKSTRVAKREIHEDCEERNPRGLR